MRVVGWDRHHGTCNRPGQHGSLVRQASAPPHHIRLASPRHVEDTSTKGGCQVSSVTQLLHGGGGHVMFMAGGWQ